MATTRSPAVRSAARRTQQQHTEETQAALLDATIACLHEVGYAATSTTLVSERAGVSRGAQTHHYPTKTQLVVAAITRAPARLSALTDPAQYQAWTCGDATTGPRISNGAN